MQEFDKHLEKAREQLQKHPVANVYPPTVSLTETDRLWAKIAELETEIKKLETEIAKLECWRTQYLKKVNSMLKLTLED